MPLATSSSGVKPRRRKRRIVSTGPSNASGGITTFTREPSGSRASHSGSASSTRRPSGARIRSIASRSSVSLAKRTAVGSSRPPRSTHTGAVPHDHHLVDRRVAQERLQRTEPERPLGDPARQLGPRARVEHRRLAIHQRADPVAQLAFAGIEQQALAQVGGELVEVVHHPPAS